MPDSTTGEFPTASSLKSALSRTLRLQRGHLATAPPSAPDPPSSTMWHYHDAVGAWCLGPAASHPGLPARLLACRTHLVLTTSALKLFALTCALLWMIGLLACATWVGHSFTRENFKYLWPISVGGVYACPGCPLSPWLVAGEGEGGGGGGLPSRNHKRTTPQLHNNNSYDHPLSAQATSTPNQLLRSLDRDPICASPFSPILVHDHRSV
jgi:hypothetical protein